VIISISPMIGSSSLDFTGFPRATFFVPGGAKNGGRGLPSDYSRLGTRVSCGVPTNIGLGSFISTATNPELPVSPLAGGAFGCSVTFAVGVSVGGLGGLVVSTFGVSGVFGAELVDLGCDCCPGGLPSGGDFLQETTKHRDITNNTRTQIFTIELILLGIISFKPQKLTT